MVLESIQVVPGSLVSVELPDGSIPLEFIVQSGNLFLWYLDSGFTAKETFKYQIAARGDKVNVDPSNWFGHIKIGSYREVFKLDT